MNSIKYTSFSAHVDKFFDLFISGSLFFTKTILPKSIYDKLEGLLIKKDYIKSIAGLILFNSIGGVLILFLQFFIANKVGVVTFGEYSYYVAIGTVGAVFTRYGRNKTMLRDLIHGKAPVNQIVVSTFVIGILNTLLFNLVIVASQNLLDYDYNLISFFVINGIIISSLDFQPLYESQGRFSFHSLILFGQKVYFSLIIFIYYFMYQEVSILIVSIALFLSWLLMLLTQLYDLRSLIYLNFSLKDLILLLANTYKVNFYVATSTVVGIAFGPILRILLKNEYNDVEVGIYSAAFQILVLSEFLMNQISRIGNPLMAKCAIEINENLPEVRRKILVYLIVVLVSVLPFSLLMIFFPATITNVILSSEYKSVSVLLPILGLYLIFLSIGVVFAQFLISIRKDKYYITGYIIGGVMTVIVGFILIKPYGALGATLALGVSHSISCVIYMFYSLKIIFK